MRRDESLSASFSVHGRPRTRVKTPLMRKTSKHRVWLGRGKTQNAECIICLQLVSLEFLTNIVFPFPLSIAVTVNRLTWALILFRLTWVIFRITGVSFRPKCSLQSANVHTLSFNHVYLRLVFIYWKGPNTIKYCPFQQIKANRKQTQVKLTASKQCIRHGGLLRFTTAGFGCFFLLAIN